LRSSAAQSESVSAAAFDVHNFRPGRSDPRLAECLKDFPAAIFSEQLYQSIELIERYSIELAVDLLSRLNLLDQLGAWRSVDELCGVLYFQPRFRPALQWILTRLLDAACLEIRHDTATRWYRLRNTPGQPDLKYLRALGLNIDPANAATLNLLDYTANAYPAVARGDQTDHSLFGPEGVPLWISYFHNQNPTYAINNWVAAAAAGDRVFSRPTLRILEIGAGAGSATEILLRLLTERGLGPRLERYVITEPNAYFRRCNERKLRAQYPHLPLEWSALNLDEPWNQQGVAAGEFDLVFAVNVMHISKHLLFSLNEARLALTAGGWLVIGECVRPYDNQPIYPELMFQILDSFTEVELDPEIRPNPGFLTIEQWQSAFLKAGFPWPQVAPDIQRIRGIYRHFFTAAICGQILPNRNAGNAKNA
jgi:SAM-dependent methyltransferase